MAHDHDLVMAGPSHGLAMVSGALSHDPSAVSQESLTINDRSINQLLTDGTLGPPSCEGHASATFQPLVYSLDALLSYNCCLKLC